MIVPRCVLLIAAAAVAVSVPVSQEEYVRYIAQQQTQRLEEKPEKHQPAAVPRARPIGQVVVGAYQQPSATRSAYQQPGAYQPAYQPQAYAQPSYLSPQTYQQPEEYQQQQPEEPYQAPARAPAAHRPKAGPYKPKPSNRPEKPEDEENDNNPNAQYQFSFDISDDESTNYHNRKEQRDGEKISGSYSVVDSDGFIRTVTYTADPEEGFKAEVSREPTNIHVKIPTPAPQTAAPAPQYRLPERKPQPQYIAVQASEQAESAGEQPAEPISGYYRPAPQSPVKSPAAAAVHRFAAPRPQLQAGSRASALGYATGPASPPIIYQAYQQQ